MNMGPSRFIDLYWDQNSWSINLPACVTGEYYVEASNSLALCHSQRSRRASYMGMRNCGKWQHRTSASMVSNPYKCVQILLSYNRCNARRRRA